MLELKLMRIAAGLSQKKLAELCNVSQGAVSQWERGASKPGFRVIGKLAAALNVSADDLLKRG